MFLLEYNNSISKILCVKTISSKWNWIMLTWQMSYTIYFCKSNLLLLPRVNLLLEILWDYLNILRYKNSFYAEMQWHSNKKLLLQCSSIIFKGSLCTDVLINTFFISNYDQSFALRFACIFKVFGVQGCLMVVSSLTK